MRRIVTILAATSVLALASHANAAPELTFTTLGTNSGPIPRADRSEPANLVRYGDQNILVDVGDGAPEQLAKVNVPLSRVQTLAISHLHFDHTAGLFALLSLRFQSRQNVPLNIYGPPGTQELVSQLLVAMRPAASAVKTMGPQLYGGPEAGIKVVELRDGGSFSVGDLRVDAVENNHFPTLGPASPDRPISLAYKFSGAGRTIVYTGDTGPSAKVAQFCKGADLLVSEMMDPTLAVAKLMKFYPNRTPESVKAVEDHFRQEHLSPTEVGKLAAACGVKKVVATHNSLERDELAGGRAQIAAEFKGEIALAEDLQTF